MESFREEDPGPAKSGAAHILIVEDHEPTSSAIAALLRSRLEPLQSAGRSLTVKTLPDAESALKLIADSQPDVVVMDISLPGMNGIEATRRLRAVAPSVPVIINSRNDTDVYRAMAAAAGVSAFISKQHTAEDLVPAILSILDGAERWKFETGSC